MSSAQSSGLSTLLPHLSTEDSTIVNTFQQVIGAICAVLKTCLLQLGPDDSSQLVYEQYHKMSTYLKVDTCWLFQT